ncbi:MerR family transcriptional regulator [Streptomyces alkaliterrae]|uniref:MerR family transcriptional regulator n=1 Tax=Streptomyces alkaliterrae TaxID=2213162 RepID=A0A5P0YQC2_9ACTN|nr:MerR family transcriptional regulator [Streptomyces alkaliterrae]MBB1255024.1 MerR family transcriptional regulator [Streptomyces alkaliterrae]MBB1259477.1 MerR family transcriptional regulator [Streptomyces alkaliterrae]MQS01632.1 MerR family transcriptional regulator [Streptomyces alkaliterrae]
MRLAELSERSGVSTATIKYYLREGLLPPGERITATQSEYGEDHLRRLRLVRALIQVGRVPVATAREVLGAVDDTALDMDERLGIAVGSLPHQTPEDPDDPNVSAARETVEGLLGELGWPSDRSYPAGESLVTAVATLRRLDYPCDVASLLPYGRLAAELAVSDLDMIAAIGTPVTQLEAAVALTVLYEPVLLSLRRMAHAEESRRRYSTTGDGDPDVPAEPADG